jgi:hypothetical protein
MSIIIYCIQDGVADRAAASATKQCIYISGHHEDGTDQGPIDDATEAPHDRYRGVVHHFVFFFFLLVGFILYTCCCCHFLHTCSEFDPSSYKSLVWEKELPMMVWYAILEPIEENSTAAIR